MPEREQPSAKRTVAVTVRMSEADALEFEKMASKVWPDALMSRAAVLLSFARIGLRAIRKEKK